MIQSNHRADLKDWSLVVSHELSVLRLECHRAKFFYISCVEDTQQRSLFTSHPQKPFWDSNDYTHVMTTIIVGPARPNTLVVISVKVV
jgi:hypothetical protein